MEVWGEGVRGADEPEYGEEMYESKWKESIERGRKKDNKIKK
jgi:hypothetical protein